MNQYVYLIKCEQYTKIGVASDVDRRVAELSTGNPFPLKVLSAYQAEDAVSLERLLHQLFRGHRHRGEWFALPDNTLWFLRDTLRVLSEGGTAATIPDNTPELVVDDEPLFDNSLGGGLEWRLERRPGHSGYAVYQRGKEKRYLGYVPAAAMKDPNNPTVEEIERTLFTTHTEVQNEQR